MLSTLLKPIKLVYGPFGKSNMHRTFDFYPIPDQTSHTVATDELLCLKNAGAQTSMLFTSNEGLAPMAIEKNQNPGGRFGATS